MRPIQFFPTWVTYFFPRYPHPVTVRLETRKNICKQLWVLIKIWRCIWPRYSQGRHENSRDDTALSRMSQTKINSLEKQFSWELSFRPECPTCHYANCKRYSFALPFVGSKRFFDNTTRGIQQDHIPVIYRHSNQCRIGGCFRLAYRQ